MEKEAERGRTYPIELPMISFKEVCSFTAYPFSFTTYNEFAKLL